MPSTAGDFWSSSSTMAAPLPWWQRRWVRWTAVGLATSLVLLVLFVLLLPTLLSTGPVTRLVLRIAKPRMAGDIRVGEVSLGWFSGQRVRGIAVLDASGKKIAEVDSIALGDVSIFSLLRGNRDLGLIRIEAPNVTFEQNEDGSTNFDAAFAPPAGAKKSAGKSTRKSSSSDPVAIPPELRAKLEIVKGRAAVKLPGRSAINVSELSVKSELGNALKLTASTRAAVTMHGRTARLDVQASATDLFDKAGKLQEKRANFDASVALTNIPLIWAETEANLPDVLTSAIGQVVSVRTKASGTLKKLASELAIDSEWLNVEAGASIASDQVSLSKPLTLRWKITPEAWSAASKLQGQTEVATLAKPVELSLDVPELSVPMNRRGPDITAIATNLLLTMSDVEVDAPAPVGRVAVRGFKTQIASSGLGNECRFDFASTVEQARRPGSVAVTAILRDLLNPDGSPNLTKMSVDGTASVNDLSLMAMDELLHTKGLLTTALGSRLAANVSAKVAPNQESVAGVVGSFVSSVTSERLNVKLAGRVNPAAISLEPSSLITLSIQPELIPKVVAFKPDAAGALKDIELTTPVNLRLALNKLDVPLSPKGFLQTVARVGLQVDQLIIRGPATGGTAGLRDLTLTVETPELAKRVSADLRMMAERGQHNGSIALKVDADQLLDSAGQVNLTTSVVNVTGNVDRIPLRMADPWTPWAAVVAPLLGDDVSATWQAKAVGPGAAVPQINASAQVKMQRFEVSRLEVATEKEKVVAQIDAALTAAPLAAVDAIAKTQGLILAALGPALTVGINTQATSTIKGEQLSARTTVKAQSAGLDVALKANLADGLLTLGEGSRIETRITPESLANIFAAQGMTTPPIRLAQPMVASLSFHGISIPVQPAVKLEAARIGAVLTVDQIAIADPVLSALAVRQLKVEVPAVALSSDLTAKVDAEIHGSNGNARPGRLSASASAGELLQAPKLRRASLTLSALPVPLLDALAQQGGKLQKILGPQIDTIAVNVVPQDEAFSSTVRVESPALQVGIESLFTPGKSLSLKSDSYVEARVKPEVAAFLMTGMPMDPALVPEPNVTLLSPAVVRLALNQIEVPLRAPASSENKSGETAAPAPSGPVDLAGVKAKTVLTVQPLSLKMRGDEKTISLRALKLDTVTRETVGEAESNLAATIEVTVPGMSEPLQANVKANAIARNLWDARGTPTPQNLAAKSKLDIAEIKTRPIDEMLKQDGQIINLLGRTVSLVVDGDYTAGQPTQAVVDVKSPNLQVNVPAALSPANDELTLTKDATLRLTMSPALARLVLEKVNPMLVTGVGSSKPVQLTLDAKAFRVPLPVNGVEDPRVHGVLDLGNLTLNNGGMLSVLMLAVNGAQAPSLPSLPTNLPTNVGQSKNASEPKAASSTQQIQAEFAPMFFTLEKGILTYKRLVMSTNANLNMKFEGQVNLVTRQLDVPTTVSNQSLLEPESGGGVASQGTGGSGRSFKVTVSMKGTIDKPELDTKRLIAEIAKQVAKDAAGDAIGKAGAGALPGGGIAPPKLPGFP